MCLIKSMLVIDWRNRGKRTALARTASSAKCFSLSQGIVGKVLGKEGSAWVTANVIREGVLTYAGT